MKSLQIFRKVRTSCETFKNEVFCDISILAHPIPLQCPPLELHNIIDISPKELDEFIGNMSTQNFEEVGKFFETMPKLQHVIKVKNPKTKKTGKITIEGMQSFFV